jgi:hypothetical protein
MVGALRELIELLLTEIAISGTDGKSLRHLVFSSFSARLRFCHRLLPVTESRSLSHHLPAFPSFLCSFDFFLGLYGLNTAASLR